MRPRNKSAPSLSLALITTDIEFRAQNNTQIQLNDQSKVEGLIFANPLFSQQTWSGYFSDKIFGMIGMQAACPDYLNDYHFNNDYNTDCEFFFHAKISSKLFQHVSMYNRRIRLRSNRFTKKICEN